LVVPAPPVAMPIMNVPQSSLETLPSTVRAKITSVAVCETSTLTMSNVPFPSDNPASISSVESW